MLRRFAAAWRFLTVIPFPLAAGDDELDQLARSAPMFPAVGLALGVLAWAAVGLAALIFPPMVAAVVAVAILAAFSGGLHLDGLTDSADALLSATHDRDKALAIMKDSRIGAHGAMALAVVLLLKFACFASLEPGAMAATAFAAPVAGRAAMLFPMAWLPYVRERGLGRLFVVEDWKRLLAYACLWTGGAMLALWGVRGVMLGGCWWLALTMGWVVFLKRRLGGATGDGYGAACELGEIAACLAGAMLWYEPGF